MPKLFEFAFFPAAKDADKFHLLRLDQLASLLNVNHKDSMFLDDRGVERPYQDLDKYIFYSYERISLKQPEKLNPSPNRKYLTFDPSFRVVNRPATPQILMLFEENRNPGRQPWVFQRWCVGWDHVILAKSRSHTVTHTTMRLNGPRQEPNFHRKEKEKTTVPVTIPTSLHEEEVQRPTGHFDEAMADEAPLAFAAQLAEDAAANAKARSAGTRELTNVEDCIAHRAAAQPAAAAAAATPVEFERTPAEPALPSMRRIAEMHLERHLSTKPTISERVEELLKESIKKDQISVHSHFKEWNIKEWLPDLHRELSHELEVDKDITAFFLEALVREAQKGTAWNNKEQLHVRGDDREKLARKQELLSRIVTYEQLCCVSGARLASGTPTTAWALTKLATEVNCTTTYLGQYLGKTKEFKAAVDRLVVSSRDLDASSSVERDSSEARIEARIADAAISIAHKDWISGYKAKSKGLSADPVGKGNMDRRGNEGEAGVERLLQVQHRH